MGKQTTNQKIAFFSVLLAALLGGGISPLSKLALTEIPPFAYTFLRFLIAGLFIFPLFLRERPKLDRDIVKPIFVSLLATTNVVLFAFGIRLTSANIAQVLYTTVPIIVTILSFFLLREKIANKKVLGIVIGFIGALIIIVLPLFKNGSSPQSSVLGNLLIFIALFSYAYYSVVSKKLQVKYSPLTITTIFIMVTVFVQFFFAIGDYIRDSSWIQYVSSEVILATLYVGFAGTFIYCLLLQSAIKYGSPMISSLTLYLQPVATFIWATILLGESLTREFLFGAVLIFAGTMMTTWARAKK